MNCRSILAGLVSLLISLSSMENSIAQNVPAIQWQNTIGGSAPDYLSAIQQTTDGGYICGGWSESDSSGDKTENGQGFEDLWVIKLDSTGGILWQNTIGGNGFDELLSLQETTDGGYILGCLSNSDSTGDKTEESFDGTDDYWIVKLDPFGSIQWQNTIGGDDIDDLNCIQQTTDGGYICGGVSNSSISGDKTEASQGGTDYWVIKLDSIGGIQWQNTIGGSLGDALYSVQQTLDGGYICGGISNSPVSGDKTESSQGLVDYWIVKLDSSGAIEWQNTIGGSGYDYLYVLKITPDNGSICGGRSRSPISGDKTEDTLGVYDYWVVKLDSTGAIQWQNTLGGSGADNLYSIDLTSDGGYFCGGFSISPISGDKTEDCFGSNDYWAVKLDSAGVLQWQKTIGGSDADDLFAVQQCTDGGFVCGGWSRSDISGIKTEDSQGDEDYWVVKLLPEPTDVVSLESNSPAVILYPNPAYDKFEIHISDQTHPAPIRVEIYENTGKLVGIRQLNGYENVVFNVNQYPEGIYLVRVIFKGGYARENRVTVMKL